MWAVGSVASHPALEGEGGGERGETKRVYRYGKVNKTLVDGI